MEKSALLEREAALRAENELLNKNLDEIVHVQHKDSFPDGSSLAEHSLSRNVDSSDLLQNKPPSRQGPPSRIRQPSSKIPRPASRPSQSTMSIKMEQEKDPSRKLEFESDDGSDFENYSSPGNDPSHPSKGRAPAEKSVARFSYTSPESIEANIDKEIDPNLPLEIQVRMLRSSLKMARLDAVTNASIADDLQIQLREKNRDASAVVEEKNRLARTVAQAEKALQKAKEAATTASTREMELRTQLLSYQKEAKQASRVGQQGQSNATVDARIARLQEEKERLQEQLKKERTSAADAVEEQKAEVRELQSSMRKLEKQKHGKSLLYIPR